MKFHDTLPLLNAGHRISRRSWLKPTGGQYVTRRPGGTPGQYQLWHYPVGDGGYLEAPEVQASDEPDHDYPGHAEGCTHCSACTEPDHTWEVVSSLDDMLANDWGVLEEMLPGWVAQLKGTKRERRIRAVNRNFGQYARQAA